MWNTRLIGLCIIGSMLLIGMSVPANDEFDFQVVRINEPANMWWARTAVDINGDGLLDLALQDNNAHGGWLGWFEAQNNGKTWVKHVIAEKTPNGNTFASGDLDAGDIDNDGDIDILGIEHPGEWDDGGADSIVYWYENPSWQSHKIGTIPDFVKDVNLVDLNQDGKLDLVGITFESNSLTVFRQDQPNKWEVAESQTVKNLHEGMDVGDIDGDGDIDIAANGYWLENPGADMKDDWIIRSVNDKWHNQDGDWSRNATKHFCRDIDGDGRAEIFITHSERAGYPLAYYDSENPKEGEWEEHIIAKELVAAHTLQVFDMDNDGDQDVLAGLNKNRAKGLGEETFPVNVYLNDGSNQKWKVVTLSEDGIYNGQAADIEGDGDMDIIRLSTHNAEVLEVWLNQAD